MACFFDRAVCKRTQAAVVSVRYSRYYSRAETSISLRTLRSFCARHDIKLKAINSLHCEKTIYSRDIAYKIIGKLHQRWRWPISGLLWLTVDFLYSWFRYSKQTELYLLTAPLCQTQIPTGGSYINNNCLRMREDAMFPVWLGHVTWIAATTMRSYWLLGDHTMAASLAERRQRPPDVDSTSGHRQLLVLSLSERRRAGRPGTAGRRYSNVEDDLQMVDHTHRRPWQINRGYHASI